MYESALAPATVCRETAGVGDGIRSVVWAANGGRDMLGNLPRVRLAAAPDEPLASR